MNHPTKTDWDHFDDRMVAFYKARVAAGSTTPREDTEEEFGEDAGWVVAEATKEGGSSA
jgi:hypothetical protein